jgi:hypothetical protein
MFVGYQRRADVAGLRTTLVDHFDCDLPRILVALPVTRAMPCRSRDALVLAPGRAGFPEQIADAETGLLYDPNDPEALTGGVRAQSLPDQYRTRMRLAARRRVLAERATTTHPPCLPVCVLLPPNHALAR